MYKEKEYNKLADRYLWTDLICCVAICCVILEIYLLLPVIARGMRKAKIKSVMWITLVFAVFLWGLAMLNVLFRANDQTLFKNLGIPVSIYFVYILFGYLIKKGMFRKVKSVVLLAGGAVLFGFAIWEQLYSYICEIRNEL